MLLGLAMLLVSGGLVVVGGRVFAHRGLELDGQLMVSPVEYVVPWALAVVVGLAAYHVLHRRSRDELF